MTDMKYPEISGFAMGYSDVAGTGLIAGPVAISARFAEVLIQNDGTVIICTKGNRGDCLIYREHGQDIHKLTEDQSNALDTAKL